MFFNKKALFDYFTKKCVKSAAIMGLMLAPMLSGFSENIDLQQKNNNKFTTSIQTKLESENTPKINSEIEKPSIAEMCGEYIQKNGKAIVTNTITGKMLDYATSQFSTAGMNLAKNYVDLDNISANLNSAANLTNEYIKNYIPYVSSCGIAASITKYGTLAQTGMLAAKELVSNHPNIAIAVGGFVIIQTAKAAIKYYPDVKNKISSLFNQTLETLGVAMENSKTLTNKVLEILGDNGDPNFPQKLLEAISNPDNKDYLELITKTLNIQDTPDVIKETLTLVINNLIKKNK